MLRSPPREPGEPVGQGTPPPADATEVRTPRWTIVLVDDDAEMCARVRDAIAAATNWRCLVAASAADARTLLSAVEADVLLVDERMPDEGGIELVSSLNVARALGAMTVILLTSGRRGIALPRCFAGAIEKPFDPFTLPTRIAAVVAEAKIARVP